MLSSTLTSHLTILSSQSTPNILLITSTRSNEFNSPSSFTSPKTAASSVIPTAMLSMYRTLDVRPEIAKLNVALSAISAPSANITVLKPSFLRVTASPYSSPLTMIATVAPVFALISSLMLL